MPSYLTPTKIGILFMKFSKVKTNYGTGIMTRLVLAFVIVTEKKQVSMIRKYHNHALQRSHITNTHRTPGIQTELGNQLPLPYQDECNTRNLISLLDVQSTFYYSVISFLRKKGLKMSTGNKRLQNCYEMSEAFRNYYLNRCQVIIIFNK